MDTTVSNMALSHMLRRLAEQPLLGGVCSQMRVHVGSNPYDIAWQILQRYEFDLGHGMFKCTLHSQYAHLRLSNFILFCYCV